MRTPKVKNRTAAPAIYVLIPYSIVAFSLLTLWRDAQQGNWGNAAFAALNAVCWQRAASGHTLALA